MFASSADRTWLWLAAGFYLIGLLLGTLSVFSRGRRSTALVYGVVLTGYVFQTIGLYLRGRTVGGCPLGNHFEIIQFTAWSATSVFLLIGATFRLSLLGHFTASLSAVLSFISLIIPSWDATRRAHIFGGNAWIEFHAALALFSYGVFGLLALTSVMFLLRNHSLKSKRVGGGFSFLPSILDLDHIGYRLLGLGVALMTAAVLVGARWWLHDLSTVNYVKISFTVAVWFAYALTLFLRAKRTLIAQRFAWTCALLFIAALISLGPVSTDLRDHPTGYVTGHE
ncbi:cytochrome c biogenesis protein [Horticoccus luteus]|uniref:Cytochrome c biogenesis protein n=1 Tax=Horticoccus luteus TaxID=2862869 RepID=A0A8F9TXJ8_9BACT|nr:cytochrome c biogenesis protein CcsA [Horticoccus luteus]QYM79970.1 cytochrome c biogenesis protein [Horticoccus luteus]